MHGHSVQAVAGAVEELHAPDADAPALQNPHVVTLSATKVQDPLAWLDVPDVHVLVQGLTDPDRPATSRPPRARDSGGWHVVIAQARTGRHGHMLVAGIEIGAIVQLVEAHFGDRVD